MNIGIFDTGVGGEIVAEKLKKILPTHNYTVVKDAKNSPYGNKTSEEIKNLTNQAIQTLLNNDIIILACNTATAAAINYLREKYPTKIFIGFEPMIKLASSKTKTGRVTLLATNYTKNSKRLKLLVDSYGAGLTIDKPNTENWAKLIDDGLGMNIDLTEVKNSIDQGSDTIIIGCTHYNYLKKRLSRLIPEGQILEPTEAIAKRIEQLQ